MTISDRREREKQMRRESIVDAAEKLFFKKGIAAATMDEVAEAAELSKGTIYLYFKNKESLYVAVVIRAMTLLKKLFVEAFLKASTGLEKLDYLGRTLISFYKDYPDYFTVLFYHHDNPPVECNPDNPDIAELMPEVVRHGNELFEIAIEAIKQGVADGSIRPDVNPRLAALSIHTFIIGLIRMVSVEEKYILKKFEISGSDFIAYAVDLIGRSLAASKAEG